MDNHFDRELNPAMTNAPWKHSWKHAMFDRCGGPLFEIEVVSYRSVAGEIVEDFASYLMGCGFFQGNIIEAFEDYVIEHKEALIAGTERFKNVDKQTGAD